MRSSASISRHARATAAVLCAIAPCSLRTAAAPELSPPALRVPRSLPRAAEAVLPTGLRVVVVEHHRRPLVGVALVLPTGTLADPRDGSGATYLAVQLASDYYEREVDGTSIPDEKSFRRRVIEMGGDVTFEAAADASVISFSGLATDAGAYLRLLADAMARPRRGGDSFLTRRNKLLDALDDLETSDPAALQQAVREAAFGSGSPYARPGRGTSADLTRLGLEMVEAQQDRVLVPSGATLVVVGDVQTARIMAEAREAFRRWDRVGEPAPRWTEPAFVSRPGVGYLRRQPAATLAACAARPLTGVKATNAQLEVLAALLGGGYRNRLMLSLREQGGLAYTASAGLVRRRHARALLACAAVAGDRAGEGLRRMRQVLAGLRTEPPTEEELARARALAVAEREASVENASAILDAWIGALVLGQTAPDPGRECAEIEHVTAADLQRVAREVFSSGSVLWILSGDRMAATAAADANELGPLRPLRAH
jgi:predicted Zn-dependent peptidase